MASFLAKSQQFLAKSHHWRAQTATISTKHTRWRRLCKRCAKDTIEASMHFAFNIYSLLLNCLRCFICFECGRCHEWLASRLKELTLFSWLSFEAMHMHQLSSPAAKNLENMLKCKQQMKIKPECSSRSLKN